MKPKPENTIQRANWLIREGYVQDYEGDGVTSCWSQTHGKDVVYFTTVDSCTCFVGKNIPSVICKHRLAAHGKEIVALASDMYGANSEDELVELAEAHAESVKDAPEDYLKFARKIYMVQLERLREEKEKAEAATA